MLPHVNETPTVCVDEAARLLGISRGSAYAAVRRGEISSIRVGKRILIPTAPLRRLLEVDDFGPVKDARSSTARVVDKNFDGQIQ